MNVANQHFKTVAGVTPLAYQTEWRKRLAERGERRTIQVSALAQSLGYTSENAGHSGRKPIATVVKAYGRFPCNVCGGRKSLLSERCVLDRNGLMSAEEQAGESKHEQ
jgi:AraC-like DNA-binding protein